MRFLRWLCLLLTAGMGGLLLQHHWGLGLREEIAIEGKNFKSDQGFAAKFKLPEEHRRILSHTRLLMLEDGKEIGFPVRSNDRVREQGRGRYRVLNGFLRFSSPDSSDPLANGRSYAASLPVPVKSEVLIGTAVALGLSLGGMFWLARRRGLGNPLGLPQIQPRWDLVLILALALVVRLYVLWAPAFNSGGLTIKGVPFSDGHGWNEMAIGLAEGKGMTGRFAGYRPLYALYLGGIYALIGESFQAAKLLNVFCGTLAAGLLYLLGSATGSRVVGWAMGILGALFSGYLSMIHLTATEALGFLLTLMSVFVLWRALLGNRWHLYLLAGLFFALANMTRTFTLLAFPGYLLLIAAFAIPGANGFKGYLRRALPSLIAFGAATALVLTPLLIRQKQVYGAFTISTNSAEALYGAASEEGKWGTAQYEEAAAAGVPETTQGHLRFFSQRLKETGRADPAKYLQNRWGNYVTTWSWFGLKHNLFGAVGAVALLALAIRVWNRGAWPRALIGGCIVAALWWALGQFPLTEPEKLKAIGESNLLPYSQYWLLPLSAAVILLRAKRSDLAMLATLMVTLTAGQVMSALIGNASFLRSIDLSIWIVWLIHLYAVHTIIARPWNREHRDEIPVSASGGVFAGAVLWWFLITIPLALGILGWKMHTRSEEDIATHFLSEDEYAEARAWGAAEIEALGGLTSDRENRFYASLVSIQPYQIPIAGGEDVDHFAPIFEVREKPRVAVLLRQGVSTRAPNSHQAAQIPGDLSELEGLRDALAIGVVPPEGEGIFRADNRVVEILALIPYDRNSGVVNYDRAVEFPPSQKAKEIVDNP